MTEVTNENYYNPEIEREYMTYSQFKGFLECEAQELAILEERYEKPSTDALLQGSYVDAHFSGEMEEFTQKHPEMFKKDGSLLAKFDVCQNAIKAIEEDEYLKENFYGGLHQEVLICEIAGVKFKCKLDNVYPNDKLVDEKLLKDTEDVWDAALRKRVPFWEYYLYHIQAAIYQEGWFQKTGQKLPYYLAVATKTTPTEKHVYRFSQAILDKALELVKALAPKFQKIKNHEIEPEECGHCGYYHSTHKFNVFDIVDIVEDE